MNRILILAGIPALVLFAQTKPQFEVASIKPNTSGTRKVGVSSPPGGRFYAENVWVRFLIQVAYNVKEFQISGGPAWINSDRFDITAKAESNLNFEQQRPLLQSLLEDRFQLVLHRETRDLPVYALTATKGGPKLQLSKEGDCVTFVPNMPPPPSGQKPPLFCGNVSLRLNGIDARAINMQRLASTLSDVLGRTVIDKTGFTGTFDVHSDWIADQATPGLVAPGLPPDPAKPLDSPDAGPSIFTALQEQLGLKLESTKGPVEVLIIDHVEQPSEN